MARRADSVIGIDLGKHAFKAVTLKRKSDSRFVLTSFALHEVPETFENADDLARQVKLLLRDLGNGSRVSAVAVSEPNSLLRIVEQPETPVELLRNGLRLHGMSILNQDCKDFVIDAAPIHPGAQAKAGQPSQHSGSTEPAPVALQSAVTTNIKYLVAGVLRQKVKQIVEAMNKVRLPADILQVGPMCSFNAFELAYPEIFAHEPFLLLDMGHLQSTVLIGSKSELVLARSIEYGGKILSEALIAEGALEQAAVWGAIRQAEDAMIDICRNSLARLATEVRNSIGFFEGQHEESINRVFVSGGLAHFDAILQILSDALGLPCEVWDPLETCEVTLSAAKRQTLPDEFVSLGAACGAAFEYLRS